MLAKKYEKSYSPHNNVNVVYILGRRGEIGEKYYYYCYYYYNIIITIIIIIITTIIIVIIIIIIITIIIVIIIIIIITIIIVIIIIITIIIVIIIIIIITIIIVIIIITTIIIVIIIIIIITIIIVIIIIITITMTDRPNAPNMILLVTGNEPSDMAETEAQVKLAIDSGVTLLAVGVGLPEDLLKALTGPNPGPEQTYWGPGVWAVINIVVDGVKNKVCSTVSIPDNEDLGEDPDDDKDDNKDDNKVIEGVQSTVTSLTTPPGGDNQGEI